MVGRDGGATGAAWMAWGWSAESDQAWADLRTAVSARVRTLADQAAEAEPSAVIVPIGDGELAGLLAAWMTAQERAGHVLSLLVLLGFDAGDIPELSGSLDATGAPAVALGRVDVVVLRQLVRILDGAAA